MKVLGLITEYNPFHNGHKYHLDRAKEITNSDYTVCVMSGNFIQRGEPALVDKWSRAKMALMAGVDLVLELPVVYSLQSAELFSYGSIRILDSLGIVNCICFGSESGNIELLKSISSILNNEPEEYKILLNDNLNQGLSFPSARFNALAKYFNETKNYNDKIVEILNSPNNILGIEYLKALQKLNSSMIPYTLTRVSNSYNSKLLSGNISSATAIRHTLFNNGDIKSIKDAVPQSTYDILYDIILNGNGPVFSNNFDNLVLSSLRKLTTEEISNIFDVKEGLENRIKKASTNASTIDGLIKQIKTKRYTQTRIQRILYHSLLGIQKSLYDELSKSGGPQYIRVLGINDKGKEILSKARKKSTLPIITKISDYINSNNKLLSKMLHYDVLSTNIYCLGCQNDNFRMGDLDYTHGIVIEK